jgi:hypothetical protein
MPAFGAFPLSLLRSPFSVLQPHFPQPQDRQVRQAEAFRTGAPHSGHRGKAGLAGLVGRESGGCADGWTAEFWGIMAGSFFGVYSVS